MTDVSFGSASHLALAIRNREVGALEVLDHVLSRLDRFNPSLNAVVATDIDAARVRSREADTALARGDLWGPLHGLPMTVKDAFEVAGMPATCGDPNLEDHVPQTNATAVQRAVDAGAVIYGKTNVPIQLFDFQSYNEIHGTTNNPWDISRTPGGSSGGAAAALSAGLTTLEIGSDIGGSIRNPAHYCGIFGHKPSFGIVPKRGHIPPPPGSLSEADLSVIGPLARFAEDLDLGLDVLAGPDQPESVGWRLDLPQPRRRTFKDYRVAIRFEDAACPIDRDYLDRLQQIADGLEGAGVLVNFEPHLPISLEESYRAYWKLLGAVIGSRIQQREHRLDRLMAPLIRLGGRAKPGTKSGVRLARAQRFRDWALTHEARQRMRSIWSEFFSHHDVLLMPVVPTPAFKHLHGGSVFSRSLSINGETRPYSDQFVWASLASLAYLPATVAPVGLTSDGLPIGVQIVGPYLEDRTTIDFAKRLSELTGGFVAPPGFGA